MTNQEFIKTEIYKDIGDYGNMSLLALSKKLPYWKRIYNQDIGDHLKKIYHLRNYCRDCDKDEIFIVILQRTFDCHYKPFTTYNLNFWIYYRENFQKLYSEANEYYLETTKANENVKCPCGGHYQAMNKAKHFKTKKHLNTLLEKV